MPTGASACSLAMRTGSIKPGPVLVPRFRVVRTSLSRTAGAAPPQPPSLPNSLPLVDDLPKIDLPRKFASHHSLLNGAKSRVLQVRYLGKRLVLIREPEDVAYVLSRRPDIFTKHPRQQRLKAWFGEGVGVQPDPAKHAAQREVLAPAFRADYVRQLDGVMAAAADRLVDLLRQQSRSLAEPQQQQVRERLEDGFAVDAQELFNRYALDVLGLTNLRTDLGAMRQSGALGAAAVETSSPHARAAPGTGEVLAAGASRQNVDLHLDDYPGLDLENVDLISVTSKLEASALWLLLQLPLPDSMLPGFQQYEQSCAILDKLVYGMIRQRRERGVQDQDKDLLAFMLRAQQKQQKLQQHHAEGGAGEAAEGLGCPFSGAKATADGTALGSQAAAAQPVVEITDKVIRDELVIIMHGGTNTSGTVMAMAVHSLAACPQAQQAVRAEVLEVLAGRPPGQLTAEDVRRLPFLTACINETLRLYPALPEQTRLVTQDAVVGGFQLARGSSVVASAYSMQRHPDIWPRPEEWLPQRWMSEDGERAWSHAYWQPGDAAAALGPRQPNAFLPFGAGPRSCIGRNYSLLNIQVTLATLLAAVELLPEPAAPPPNLVYAVTMQSSNGVWVRMRPRH